MSTSQLHHRQKNCHVFSIFIEIAILVFEVLDRHHFEQSRREAPQMIVSSRSNRSKCHCLLLLQIILLGNLANSQASLMDVQKIACIYPSSFESLMFAVQQLEDSPSHQFVIAVNNCHYGIIAAYLHDCIVGIFKRCLSGFLGNIDVFFFGNLEEIDVASNDEVCAISGGIIDDGYHVITVILSEDGVEIVLDSELSIIVVGSNDEANRQFLLHLSIMKPFIQSFVILHHILSLQFVLISVDAHVVFHHMDARVRNPMTVGKLDPLFVEGLALTANFLIMVKRFSQAQLYKVYVLPFLLIIRRSALQKSLETLIFPPFCILGSETYANNYYSEAGFGQSFFSTVGLFSIVVYCLGGEEVIVSSFFQSIVLISINF